MPLPSRPKLLPVSAPLGAVRESFLSYGSRLSKAILDDPAIYFHSFSLRYSCIISFAKVFFHFLVGRSPYDLVDARSVFTTTLRDAFYGQTFSIERMRQDPLQSLSFILAP